MKARRYKLTEATIRSLKPLDKRYEVPGNYPGLSLRINVKGTMTWFYQYRVKHTKFALRKRVVAVID